MYLYAHYARNLVRGCTYTPCACSLRSCDPPSCFSLQTYAMCVVPSELKNKLVCCIVIMGMHVPLLFLQYIPIIVYYGMDVASSPGSSELFNVVC